jgi:hypothetical protein
LRPGTLVPDRPADLFAAKASYATGSQSITAPAGMYQAQCTVEVSVVRMAVPRRAWCAGAQEQSTLSVKNARRTHENVRLFDGAIKAAGARTALYMTWARQNAAESQQAISNTYASVGRELGATVVPVGLAWQRFLRRHDQPVLHDKDQSHPTLAGSYLAACVFLAVLFGESPVGLYAEVAGLGEKDLALLQKAAWQECRPGRRGRSK